MPVNGFSIGRDCVLNVITPSGPLRFPLLNSFEANPDLSDEKRVALDGITRHAVFHEGWSGSLSFDRSDNNFEDYWAQVESDYYAGLNNASATIIETITEVNGAVSQYQFTGVVLKPKFGEWAGNKVVTNGCAFMATRRIKLA